ncbi:hypothetical protein EsH8_IX_000819 [Colletotrichum jinshuiense]
MADVKGPVLTDIFERVLAKENVRDSGLLRLSEALEIVQALPHGPNKEDKKELIDNYNALKNNLLSREILVGILGQTGLGKSSLFNELLEAEIVPTHSFEACTAAVCIFGWNHEKDNSKKFRAKITFKSWSVVQAELDALKEELADLESTSRVQADGYDTEYDNRLIQVNRLIKVVCNWSGLSEDGILKLSSAQIMEAGNFDKIRGRGTRKIDTEHMLSKSITASNKGQFMKSLRPYADSSEPESRPVQYWPLVEHIEIFLKSPILRHGIKLVDLPGVQDALIFRGGIAENFSRRLHKRIVVTPAVRAGDNKAAAELIFTEHEILDMHLDDSFKENSLCIAITKIDDLDTYRAENEYPTDEILDVCKRLRDPVGEEDEDEEYHSDDGDFSILRLGNKRAASSAMSRDAKRQRPKLRQPTKTRNLTEEEKNALESRLMFLCIQARNRRMVQRVTDSLWKAAETQKALKFDTSNLPPVIPVSSKAFRKMKKGKVVEGFPDAESTGILALGRWLYEVSLSHREAWADSDIHHILILLDAVDGWIQEDPEIPLVLSVNEKRRVKKAEGDIAEKLKAITNGIQRSVQANLVSMKPLRKKNLRNSSHIKAEESGEEQLKRSSAHLNRVVEGWERKSSRAATAVLEKHTSFWRGHFDNWQTEFARNFPGIKQKIRGTVAKAFDKWIKTIEDDSTLPEAFRDMVKKNSYKMENIFRHYADKIVFSVDSFQRNASKLARTDVFNILTRLMKPGFEAALSKTGKGIMKKQIQEITEFANKRGFSMFEEVRNFLEKQLWNDIHQVSMTTKNHWQSPDGCGTLMKKEFTRISKRLCARRTKKGANNESPDIDYDTKQKLAGVIGKWRKEWHRLRSRLPDTGPLPSFDDGDDEEAERVINAEEHSASQEVSLSAVKTELMNTD